MKLLSRGPEETFRYGLALGRRLKKGDTVCLYGELGSGKTTLVKGIASAFGIADREITSASFTIIAEYSGRLGEGEVPFYHIDLYRIADGGDLDSTGVEEYLGGEGLAVVEWAERLGSLEDAIKVTLTMRDEDEREITIEGIDEAAWNNM